MDFKYKYLKYKKKYLSLFKMIGGNKPSVNVLKNINLCSPEQSEYLDPTLGYIWSLNAVKNYYLFGDDNNIVTKLVKSIYLDANINMIYSKTKSQNKITPYQIGFLLGKWYNYYINERIIMGINNKYIDNNKSFDEKEINILKTIRNKINHDKKKILDIKKQNIEKQINTYKNNKDLTRYCDFTNFDKEYKEKMNYYSEYKPISVEDITEDHIREYYKQFKSDEFQNNKEDDFKTNIKGSEKLFRKIFNYYFNTDTADSFDENDIKCIFAVALSLLWNIADNKEGIKEYYRGLYKHIHNDKIEALLNGKHPNFYENFNNDELEYKEETKSNYVEFNKLLAMYHKKFKGKVSLQRTEHITVDEKSFGDCTETTIKNFIKILIYNPSKDFDLEKLKSLGTGKANKTSKIYKFFSTFNKDTDHSSNVSKKIFGRTLTVRQAWATILMNIPNVVYNKNKYEIFPGLSSDKQKNNMEAVLEHLFGSENFNGLNVNGLKVTIKDAHNIIVEYQGIKYKWHGAGDEHFDFDIVDSGNNLDIDLSSLDDYKQIILLSYNKNKKTMWDESFKEKFFNNHYYQSNYFFFFNIHTNNLYIILNSLFPVYKLNTDPYFSSNEFYNKVLDVIEKSLPDDQKRKVYINFNKLNDNNYMKSFDKYATKLDGYSLDISISPGFGNIKDMGDSFEKLLLGGLKKIKIYSRTESYILSPIGDNLEEIEFVGMFPSNFEQFVNDLSKNRTKKLKISISKWETKECEFLKTMEKKINLLEIVCY